LGARFFAGFPGKAADLVALAGKRRFANVMQGSSTTRVKTTATPMAVGRAIAIATAAANTLPNP